MYNELYLSYKSGTPFLHVEYLTFQVHLDASCLLRLQSGNKVSIIPVSQPSSNQVNRPQDPIRARLSIALQLTSSIPSEDAYLSGGRFVIDPYSSSMSTDLESLICVSNFPRVSHFARSICSFFQPYLLSSLSVCST